MNKLQVGFGRVNITPSMGTPVSGYYKDRFADGVLDPLEANALALACGDSRAVLLSLDNCGIPTALQLQYKAAIGAATGLKSEEIYISCTHTHTGPFLRLPHADKLEEQYSAFVEGRLCDAANMALKDLQEARMGFGVGQAPNIAFVRRFRMKDGSVKTNPGVDNPDILAPLGDVDERVSVLRFDRPNDSLVLVQFADHPDVVGGCKISADWPGFARETVELAIPGTKCIFFNGAEGDVNHVNVHPKGGDFNDMFEDFDDVSRGYGHARYMGRVVAGAVLQAYDKVEFVDVDQIRFAETMVRVPSNKADPKDLPEAHRLSDLHSSGRDDLIPYTGMRLTTVVAAARRMVRLENGPDYFDMPILAVAIGPLAFVGLPGEPFAGIGRALKESEGWKMVLPTCCTNAHEGYFPMQEAYDEGGYESGSSVFKAGVAEILIAEGKKLLDSLR